MKVRKWAVLLLAAAAVVWGGCGLPTASPAEPSEPDTERLPEPESEPDPNWPVQLDEITLMQMPEHVVSLSPALTEVVCELGGTLEGVSDFCDYPEEVTALERCGTPDALDLEALLSLDTDLVLASAPLAQSDQERLDEAGIPVAVFPRAQSLDALEDTYTGLSALLFGKLDGKDKGETVFGELSDRYEALKASAQTEGFSGIWLRAVPLVMATGDTMEGTFLEEALGIKNDAAEYTGWQYPQDKAVDLYPDVIFYDISIDPEYFKGTTVYNTTDAYKQNRMYPFHALYFERQSARMFDELEAMGDALAGGPQIATDAPPSN